MDAGLLDRPQMQAPAMAAAGRPAPIRVMLADDSVVVRGLVTRWVMDEPDMAVVASVRTGREAVERVAAAVPDVIVLDVEMPEMDGIEALPHLMAAHPDVAVIMASALTRHGAEATFRALARGAADYIPKPQTNHGVTTTPEFRRQLIEKIRHLGAARRGRRARTAPPAPAAAEVAPFDRTNRASAASVPPLRPWTNRRPRALLIGSSTGGPQALAKLLPALRPVIDRAPVLIAQHMPATFTAILADHLARASQRIAREAEDGEAVLPGHVYVAPGGRHMLLARRNAQTVIVVDDGPPENFCKPAVDPLFRTAAKVFGGSAVATILTGMGCDGTQGAADIAAVGGNVVAQDEATSVVWGMPGSAVNAGLCTAVLPLEGIAQRLVQAFAGEGA